MKIFKSVFNGIRYYSVGYLILSKFKFSLNIQQKPLLYFHYMTIFAANSYISITPSGQNE